MEGGEGLGFLSGVSFSMEDVCIHMICNSQ